MDIVRTQTFSLYNTYPAEMQATMEYYRKMVAALARIIFAEWEFVSSVATLNDREHKVEALVVTTAPRKRRANKDGTAPETPMTLGNNAKYPDFEKVFDSCPAYLRRAAIRDAIGMVASHTTRLKQYHEKRLQIHVAGKSGQQQQRLLRRLGNPPTFQVVTRKTPALYRGNHRKVAKAVGRRRSLENRIAGIKTAAGGLCTWLSAEHAALKLYDGSAWRWFCVKIRVPKKNRFPESEGWIEGTPSLVPTRGTFEIHVPMEKKVLFKAKDGSAPVLAVDLGLNTRATGAVMALDGTILDRAFIDAPQNTGRLEHLLGEIARSYRESGQPAKERGSCRGLWRQVAHLADEIAHQVSSELVRLARQHSCQVIVFEYLGKMKVPRDFWGAKRLRKKVHYWLQARIQRYCKLKAQVYGIRCSHVLARGTSAEAFDGSGPVRRTVRSKLAHFQNGRIYDADLAAAYNIGARYWIRELHDRYPSATKEQKDPDNAVVVGAGSKPARAGKGSKAIRENVVVAGQGITCLTAEPDVRRYVTGVQVARHRQTLASLISLLSWVDALCVNTRGDRMHATVVPSGRAQAR